MSTFQRITLIGLYNFENEFERDIFRELSLPEGYEKASFVNSLLLEHGEKCVMYPDPDFFAKAVGIWSNKWALELERIYDALTAKYNPIHNYDRYEHYEDSEGIESHFGHKATDKPNYTTENKISADNSSEYQPENKSTINGTVKDVEEKTNANSDRSLEHDAHLYGNIGVTTNQQMIEGEMQMRTKYNLYDIATRMFANELLISIY